MGSEWRRGAFSSARDKRTLWPTDPRDALPWTADPKGGHSGAIGGVGLGESSEPVPGDAEEGVASSQGGILAGVTAGGCVVPPLGG